MLWQTETKLDFLTLASTRFLAFNFEAALCLNWWFKPLVSQAFRLWSSFLEKRSGFLEKIGCHEFNSYRADLYFQWIDYKELNSFTSLWFMMVHGLRVNSHYCCLFSCHMAFDANYCFFLGSFGKQLSTNLILTFACCKWILGENAPDLSCF